MPRYTLIPSQRTIRVPHFDLDKPWRSRGTHVSFYEKDMYDVETVIRQATGLTRIYRRHGRYHVGFVLRKDLYNIAACAIIIQWPDDRCEP